MVKDGTNRGGRRVRAGRTPGKTGETRKVTETRPR